jgi:predicted phage terminase large subunit-like protein
MACGEGFQTIEDSVALVEHLSQPADVYDIQVAGDHNFFANGILVHNCMIIDDPIKNSEEAFSESARENLWKWFETTAFTRLEPGGFCVVIHTRWHQDDLIGRLHAKSTAAEIPPWTLINYPALAEAEDELGREIGDPLWPARYSTAALHDIKKSISPYNWSALYQQRPTPEEGGAIKRAWWQYYDSLPTEFDDLIQSWDLAFKDLQTSDYCVGQIWGRKGARFYLVHQIRERLNLPAVASRIRSLREVYPEAHAVLIEDTANGPALIQTLHSSVAGLIPRKVKGSKDTRVAAVSPYIESGNVFLPRSSPWLSEFIEECAAFPNGTHDDQVDSMTQALIYLGPKAGTSVSHDHRAALMPAAISTPLQLQQHQFKAWRDKRLKSAANRINRANSSPFKPVR